MLNYIGNTSPECLIFPDQALNLPAPVPEQITMDIQSLVVTSVLKQHNKEKNYTHEIRDDKRSVHSFFVFIFQCLMVHFMTSVWRSCSVVFASTLVYS